MAQDVDRFRNDPRWRDRYGSEPHEPHFLWTKFYEAVAENLLGYRDARRPLVEGVNQIAEHHDLRYLQDRFSDGSTGPLTDICPFTVMGMFNRGMTFDNRRLIAQEIASLLGVEIPIQGSFEGIPTLVNLKSWFFGNSKDRGSGDINALWNVLSAASRFVDSPGSSTGDELAEAYDEALTVRGTKWNLSMGLYWAHPWKFPPLDAPSRDYITSHLGLPVEETSGDPPDGESYLALADALRARFDDEKCPVRSFPELSLAGYLGEDPPHAGPDEERDDPATFREDEREPGAVESYSIDDVVNDGCFLERDEVERMLERLRTRKNLILQGPPGTGKTWIAKRLAFAQIGAKDETKVRVVQFHPNLSYEDFVRGWRPMGDGKLALADGVFMEAIRDATSPEKRFQSFVVVIEEINRGNPAQIFGELLTLLEAGKRTPGEAIELCYPDPDGERRPVHVPENLHVIGTMNIADRSLALVDLAFRRRFAFVSLEPKLGAAWRDWVVREGGVDPERVEDIERRINELNEGIAGDPSLGRQFRIGHSYVTPTHRLENGATQDWFRQVAETEIGPLLEEYWFDSPEKAREAVERLVEGW